MSVTKMRFAPITPDANAWRRVLAWREHRRAQIQQSQSIGFNKISPVKNAANIANAAQISKFRFM